MPTAERLSGAGLRPGYFYGRDNVTFYPGMVRLPEGSEPKTHNITHAITVAAEVPAGGAEGVLVRLGGDTAGWSLSLDGGRLVYHYTRFEMERYEIVSAEPIPTGKVELRCEFVHEKNILDGPATVRLFVNGGYLGEGRVEKQVRGRFSLESSMLGWTRSPPLARGCSDRCLHRNDRAGPLRVLRKLRADLGREVALKPPLD